MRFFQVLCVAGFGIVAAGCAPVLLGAVGTGAYLGVQERGAAQAISDTKLKAQIKERLANKKAGYFTKIGIDVLNGNVLLTGTVPTTEDGGEVIDIVRRTRNAQNIYNELFVAPGYPATRKANDTWLSTKIKARLFGNKDVYQVNYMVSVVNSHVYVLGIAGSDEEHDHIIHVLRTTPGVAQVHDYITLSEKAMPPPEEAEAMKNQKRNFLEESKYRLRNFMGDNAVRKPPNMLGE